MNKTNFLEQTVTAILNSFFGIILFIISALSLYLPYEITIIPTVANILPVIQKVCIFLLIIFFILLYASRLRLFRDNWIVLAAILFFVVLLYSTYTFNVDIQGALRDSGLFGLWNLLMLAVFLKVNPKKYLLIFYILYFIINVINVYTVFHYWPNGMWVDWQGVREGTYSLVGSYNLSTGYAMPLIIAGAVWASKYGRWLEIFNYVIMIANLAMAFKCDCATQIVAYILVLFALVINDILHAAPKIYNVLKIFNAAVLVGIDFLIFVVVVVLGNTNILGKIGLSGDFHGRRAIWDVAQRWIVRYPILGQGVETKDYTIQKFLPDAFAGHCHSFYLEVAYDSGIIGSIFFIAMIIITIVAIFKARNNNVKWLLSSLLAITFLTGLMESYPIPFFVIALGLCFYIAKYDKKISVKSRKQRKKEEPDWP